MGYTSNEIAAMISLPDALEKVWYTRQYYGTLPHNAKAIYQTFSRASGSEIMAAISLEV